MHWKIFVFLSFIGLMMLNACSKSIDVAEWTEEVKLHDGRIVQVWRRARAYGNGFPNAKRGADIDFELKYELMNVSWKGDWSHHIASFEIFDGVPYLVFYMDDKTFCRNRASTDYSAQFLRWDHGQWIEIKQADFPVDQALMNVSENYWGHDAENDYKGLIRWNKKRLPGGYNQPSPDSVKAYFERQQRFCGRFAN